MPSKEQIEAIRLRRQQIKDGDQTIAPLTPEEQKMLDDDDLDNPEVQERIMNPDTMNYKMENGQQLVLHKMAATHTRKFFAYASTVTAATIEQQRAIQGHMSSDNFVIGLHIKGLLVESDVLFKRLTEFLVYASAPIGQVEEKMVPKLAKEYEESLTTDDAFNIFAILSSLTGVSKPKPKNENALQPA
jgi:hypothetical protein